MQLRTPEMGHLIGDCDLQLAILQIYKTVEIAKGLDIVTRLKVGPMADINLM